MGQMYRICVSAAMAETVQTITGMNSSIYDVRSVDESFKKGCAVCKVNKEPLVTAVYYLVQMSTRKQRPDMAS